MPSSSTVSRKARPLSFRPSPRNPADLPSAVMLIRLEHVGKTYRSGLLDVQALRDITFAVHRGEFVAIVGQSGSGKTTLLDILGCLSRPTEGRYLFDGRPVDSLDDGSLAQVRNRSI